MIIIIIIIVVLLAVISFIKLHFELKWNGISLVDSRFVFV